MSDDMKPAAPAQVAYTTNPLSAPQVGGFALAVIMAVAQYYGFTFLDSPSAQGVLSLAVGWAVGAIGSWLFPSASGRLGLTAPFAWNAPSPQDVPAGTSLVTLPTGAAADDYPGKPTTVRPANDLAAMVRVAEVAAAVASAAKGEPVTVNVTPAGQPNEAVRVGPTEIAAAPSVPVNVTPSPAPSPA